MYAFISPSLSDRQSNELPIIRVLQHNHLYNGLIANVALGKFRAILAIVLAQHVSSAHSASGRTSEATTSAGSTAEVFEMSSRRHPART